MSAFISVILFSVAVSFSGPHSFSLHGIIMLDMDIIIPHPNSSFPHTLTLYKIHTFLIWNPQCGVINNVFFFLKTVVFQILCRPV